MKLDRFTRAYIECALWSTTQDDGRPYDDDYSLEDIPPSLLEIMVRDCQQFQEDNHDLLMEAGSPEQNGHDFWLTREGHGAGFWDRGYGEVGDKLTEASDAWGNGSDEFYYHDWEERA